MYAGDAWPWSDQRFAWRRETRLLTAVAVPATTAVRAIPRINPGIGFLLSVGFGGFERVERRDDSLYRDAPAVHQQASRLADRHGDRRRPAVLPDEDGGRGVGIERSAGVLKIVLAEDPRRRACELVE